VLLFATVAFAFQIYFDFSAYTDIARGCSRVMGIELIENFRRPYRARSIADFWKRWHISLTSWFRDYVYFPMGGNKVTEGRWITNVFTVFLLSGLWHGANWTFVVWGLLHGGYYVVSRKTARWREVIVSRSGLVRYPVLHAELQVAITFLLVCFAWIFFRASDISTAIAIIRTIGEGVFTKLAHPLIGFGLETLQVPDDSSVGLIGTTIFKEQRFYFTLVVLGMFAIWEIGKERGDLQFANLRCWQRWSCYYAACLVILVIGNVGNKQFIYFQF